MRSAEQEKLILDHIGAVKAIARRIHAGLPICVQVDDLISAGYVGLIDAADRYDEHRGVSFPLYAKARIRGAILDSLRAMDWATREQRRLLKQSEATEASGGEVSDEAHFLRLLQVLQACSVEASEHRGLASTGPNAFDQCEQAEIAALVRKAIPRKLPRDADYLYRRFWLGHTHEQIGKAYGCNYTRISQLEKRILGQMRTALLAMGFTDPMVEKWKVAFAQPHRYYSKAA